MRKYKSAGNGNITYAVPEPEGVLPPVPALPVQFVHQLANEEAHHGRIVVGLRNGDIELAASADAQNDADAGHHRHAGLGVGLVLREPATEAAVGELQPSVVLNDKMRRDISVALTSRPP